MPSIKPIPGHPRRYGKPRMDAERRIRHKARTGKSGPLPPRGAGIREREEVERLLSEIEW